MFTPLPGVMAAHCDMGDMGEIDISSSSTVMPSSVILTHDMSAMQYTDSMSSDMKGHSCCDDPSTKCSGSCDLGVNVSLILQQTPYTPSYKDSYKPVSLSSKTLFRELIPPFRPPANFHS